MIKKLLSLILSFITLISTFYTPGIFRPEIKENLAIAFSKGITPREIATTYPYTYEDMVLDIAYLEMKYPDIIEVNTIGQSEWGFPIWVVILGKGEKSVMINAAHHAREYATVPLVMKMINYYAQLYESNETMEPFGNVREILDKVCIHFIPMVNPDGVKIAQNHLYHLTDEKIAELRKILKKGTDFENWKANGEGVDLNSNYPARWKQCLVPYLSEGSGGKEPGEASETKALMDYTKEQDFLSTISYHNAGEILYWYFGQTGNDKSRDYRLTKELSELTGYSLIPIQTQMQSNSGYKDWYIQEFKRPAWTIEIGRTVNNKPLSQEEMLDAWKKNKKVGLWLASMIIRENIK